MAALSAVKNQKNQKTRQKNKIQITKKTIELERTYSFGPLIMFCLFRQGIEGLMSRCQKGEGRIAVDFFMLS